MNSSSHPIRLQRGVTCDFVDALLHERIDGTYARRVDDIWLTYLAASQARANAAGRSFGALEHAHWSWHAKVAESARLLSCPTLAIECEGEPQGLMLIKTDGHFSTLPAEQGKPLVYVTYLATAPWNLSSVVDQPRYRGIGTLLTRAAVQVSLEAEFKGRIGLHSLPHAEGFYERHGFICLGADVDKESLKYYELSPQAAAAFVK